MVKMLNAKWSSIVMLVGALMAAPCFVGILLIPLGLGAFLASGLSAFLDSYRYLFMAFAVVLLGVTHWGLRRAQAEFRPTRLVWILTIITLALIAGELIVDPPWMRHALVPMM